MRGGPARNDEGSLVRYLKTATILAGLAAVSACGERDVILPGERLGVREVLETGVPDAAPPPNRSAAAALPGPANGAWTQSPVSPHARVAHAALSLPLEPLWSRDIGAGDEKRQRLNVDPVSDGTRVFTMSSDFVVTALSAAGEVLWTRDLTPLRDANYQAQGGGLALGDGRLFVASGFGTLTALDPGQGTELWTQRLQATATGAPSYRDGLVYITSGDSVGWAIEADAGRVRWQTEGLADINNVAGAPPPAIGDDRVVFAFGNGTLRTAFREGGLPLWSEDVAGGRRGRALSTIDDITGDPLIDGGAVYAGNHSGRFAAFDLFSGDRLWTANEGALDRPLAAGGSVYFVSDRNQLVRLDAADGSRVWAVDLPDWERSRRPSRRRDSAYANHGPVLAGGQLIVASSDGVIRSFRPEDGSLSGTTEIPGGATTQPIVAGGTLYVVSKRGVLHAYR
ncbi:PQQ-like beta-propeller repeat protein [Roseivivax isoporae]|uniref:Quinoprotein n=1 Tax=Roseivivax isoporae LMG 25204 TaxID=1449351 RepID=X7F1N4_9RHOB|nr:PQQ-like beta-propeller repeat protein [Roseivivax isoporae]ETX26653.1 quinoprotein [Roseivivax isoporae LMG 25204]